MSMPAITRPSVTRTSWSAGVEGSSVAPVRGMHTTSATLTRSARPAATPKVMFQPKAPQMSLPAGTPSTLAMEKPV